MKIDIHTRTKIKIIIKHELVGEDSIAKLKELLDLDKIGVHHLDDMLRIIFHLEKSLVHEDINYYTRFNKLVIKTVKVNKKIDKLDYRFFYSSSNTKTTSTTE
jgi:hypothetical protein